MNAVHPPVTRYARPYEVGGSTVYIGLGSNLADPEIQVAKAISILKSQDNIQLTAASSLYHTSPVGYVLQPDFINAVVQIQTTLAPLELLALTQQIEQQLGREKSTIANGPRIIDLDLLLYADLVIITDALIMPHPRMLQRLFVLLPLLEIMGPEFIIQNKSLQNIIANLQTTTQETIHVCK